ncbi:MAG: AAA family ATPase [Polyangia bacterium]|jgi:hypothetical protein|nr:AAA family ATPase [Polyangia bacterium]
MTISSTASPIAHLASAVADRLQPGELGVVAARAGVGKTACLVQLALTDLLAERAVLHVALDSPVRDVQSWYDRILDEAFRRGYFESDVTSSDLRLSIERHRHIHSYLQQGFTAERLEEAVSLMAEVMDFRPLTVVLDGFPFAIASQDSVTELRRLAAEQGFRLWLSVLTHRHEREDPDKGLPQGLSPFADSLDIVLRLAPDGAKMRLTVLRDHGEAGTLEAGLTLDPASLLVTSES